MHQLTKTTSHGDTRWFVQPEVAEQLLVGDGFRLGEWQRAGWLETVKTGPHRTVYRLNLPSGCFYLKHYRVGDWKAVLQNVVRPPRAILEWRAAQWVAAAGISTIETVAVGRTIRRGLVFDSFLACRAIEDSEPLDAFVANRLQQLPAARRQVVRRNLTESLGRLVAALHRDRIIHRDLHAENILVRLAPDDSLQLWLIDLHAVTTCRRLTLPHIERNLALLNPALVHGLTEIDCVRFFRSYWSALLSPANTTVIAPAHLVSLSARSVANRIAEYCRRDLIRIHHKRDRKWSDGNRRLIIADADTVRCRGLTILGRKQLLSIRDEPDAVLGFDLRERSRDTNQEQTKIITLNRGADQIACRAQFVERPLQSRWQQVLGTHSEVRRAWEMGHACLRRNIPTPRPLAIVERECGNKSRQYFLTENIPNAVSLDEFLQDAVADVEVSLRDRQLSQIAIQLAQELRHMHAEGFDYKSLGAASILVDRNQPGQRLRFASPQNVQRLHRPGPRHVAGMLTEPAASLSSHSSVRLTHFLRFLKRFLADRHVADWKTTWRTVQRGVTGLLSMQRDDRRPSTDCVKSDNSIEHTQLSKSA